MPLHLATSSNQTSCIASAVHSRTTRHPMQQRVWRSSKGTARCAPGDDVDALVFFDTNMNNSSISAMVCSLTEGRGM